MGKTAVLLAAFLFGLLLIGSFLVGDWTVGAKISDGEGYTYGLNLLSPTNTSYSQKSVLLNITIRRMFSPNEYDSKIMYSLNGEANITVPAKANFFPMDPPSFISSALGSYTLITGTAYLQKLTKGSHCLAVYGVYERAEGVSSNYPAAMQDTEPVYFTVNDGVAPSVTLLQIENKTYYKNSLPLNLIVEEQISWMVYSLDGEANVTIAGNTTLKELSYGSHSLVVYANDTVGNMGTTGIIDFNIAKPEAFPTAPVAASIAVFVMTSACLLVYFKKRRREGA